MFRMMDATRRGFAPERSDTSASSLFCLAWMFLGAFFAMNLIVGVIVGEFNEVRAAADEATSSSLSAEQQQWVETMKAARARQAEQVPRGGHENDTWHIATYCHPLPPTATDCRLLPPTATDCRRHQVALKSGPPAPRHRLRRGL